MQAFEAKEITLETKAKSEMDKFYNLIKNQARHGIDNLFINNGAINEFHISLLKKNGYRIREEFKENGYDSDRLIGYTVSW